MSLFKRSVIVLLIVLVLPLQKGWAKTYLITLATSGLGEKIAQDLANDHHSIILTGRDQEKLSSVKNKLNQTSSLSTIQTLSLDFDDPVAVDNAVGTVKRLLGSSKLDGMVLIGPRPELGKTDSIPNRINWIASIQKVFIEPLVLIQGLKDKFNNPSSLVIISGITSKYFIPGYANSNVLRGMWTYETKNLAHQFRSNGIRVNTISLGFTLTPSNKNRLTQKAIDSGLSYDEQISLDSASIPSGRHGESSDVSSLVKYLLSEESSFQNGTDIPLDGGKSPSY